MTVYFPFLTDGAEVLRNHAGKDSLVSADTALEFCHCNFKISRLLFTVDMFALGEGDFKWRLYGTLTVLQHMTCQPFFAK